MGWLTSFKKWVLSWLTDANKLRLLSFLETISAFIDYAAPIVAKIDQELKPIINLEDGSIVDTLVDFFENLDEEFDDVMEIVTNLKDLPFADLLMNVAVEIMKVKTNGSVSVSIMRLAIELAYNIYKQVGRSNDDFDLQA